MPVGVDEHLALLHEGGCDVYSLRLVLRSLRLLQSYMLTLVTLKMRLPLSRPNLDALHWTLLG
jgi:hypothetical protein